MSRILLLPLLLLVACRCAPATEPGPPIENVLVVYVDTLRADHLGAWGYDAPTSPRLDALAAESVRFERAYAPAPWTYSSTASVFTGLLPATHGAEIPGRVRDETARGLELSEISPELPTLAGLATAAGYRTAFFARNSYLGHGLDRGFETFENPRKHNAMRQTDRALEWLGELGDDDRFLMVVHYMDAHTPSISSHEDRALFPAAAELDKADYLQARKFWRKDARKPPEKLKDFEQVRDRRVGTYDASIRYLDRHVGRLLDGLGARRERTLVIFTADHGEEFWEHAALERALYKDPRGTYGIGHGHTFFEEVVRVPLLLSHPSLPPAVETGRASLVDLMPTVLDALDIDYHGPTAGRSLLAGPPPDDRELVFDAVAFGADKQGLLSGDLKLTRSVSEPPLLVDLAADPGEQVNLAPERPGDVARLSAALDRHLEAAAGLVADGPVSRSLSDEERAELEALGYIWGAAAGGDGGEGDDEEPPDVEVDEAE